MLIDLHTHAAPHSDDSELGPDELIIAAKRVGLDGICLTEHDCFRADEEIAALRRKHDFLVLPGVELNTEEEHLLVFGLKKWVIGMTRAAFVVDMVQREGGAMIVAHPYRRKVLRGSDPDSKRYHRELDRACDNPLFRAADAIEVFNARGSERENAFSLELAERLGRAGIAGSDAHELADVGRAATYFEREITDVEGLITELKAGRFRALTRAEAAQSLSPIEVERRAERIKSDFERRRRGLAT